ncbi:unnamed protein product [Clavelina lepadiformis]|uniref:Endoplasmic reticulum membrane protein complex subunit 7 n=1 Tax=Clavelina lepadiformis TaxID=159417 RepID=A0ABP0FGM4_CLALP
MDWRLLCILYIAYFADVSFCLSKVEGKVYLPADQHLADTRVILDDGEYRGFIKVDGSFVVHNVPTGSYVLEVLSPTYLFEPIRIDVSAKGNIRARRLNNLKPSVVAQVRYPLEMKAVALAKYFQAREKFSIFDMLKNPMVLMMVLPLLVFAVLPKLVNTSDPEVRKEMEESMKMFNQNSSMPDAAEFMSNLFGSGSNKPKAVTSSKSGKSKAKRN